MPISLRSALALCAAATLFAANPWVTETSGTTSELRGLRALSGSVAWASGTRGRVERTTDGGATWQVDTIAGATSLDFRSIAALDDRTAFAMAAGPAEQGQAKIFRTTDGGASWTLVYSTDAKGVFLDALAFWDSTHGIAMSDPIDGKLYLLRTDDGGQTWAHVPSEAFPHNARERGSVRGERNVPDAVRAVGRLDRDGRRRERAGFSFQGSRHDMDGRSHACALGR